METAALLNIYFAKHTQMFTDAIEHFMRYLLNYFSTFFPFAGNKKKILQLHRE